MDLGKLGYVDAGLNPEDTEEASSASGYWTGWIGEHQQVRWYPARGELLLLDVKEGYIQ